MATGTEEGGDMIEYENEDPGVRRMYEEELKKVGMTLQMPPVSYKMRRTLNFYS